MSVLRGRIGRHRGDCKSHDVGPQVVKEADRSCSPMWNREMSPRIPCRTLDMPSGDNAADQAFRPPGEDPKKTAGTGPR